jgi:hypothetical protein
MRTCSFALECQPLQLRECCLHAMKLGRREVHTYFAHERMRNRLSPGTILHGLVASSVFVDGEPVTTQVLTTWQLHLCLKLSQFRRVMRVLWTQARRKTTVLNQNTLTHYCHTEIRKALSLPPYTTLMSNSSGQYRTKSPDQNSLSRNHGSRANHWQPGAKKAPAHCRNSESAGTSSSDRHSLQTVKA